MKTQLTERQHAAAALLLLLAAMAMIYILLIYSAISERARFHERLDELQFQYRKLAHTIDRADNVRAELDRLKNSQPDQSGFLEQKQAALAAADLQKHLNTLISSSGGNVISTQVLRRNNEDTIFPEVTIKVHMRGDMGTLQDLLYRIKIGQPVLLLDNLLVQKRNISSSRQNRGNREQIDVRFDVTGFIYQETYNG